MSFGVQLMIRKDIDKGGCVCMFKMRTSRCGKDPTKTCKFGKDHVETCRSFNLQAKLSSLLVWAPTFCSRSVGKIAFKLMGFELK